MEASEAQDRVLAALAEASAEVLELEPDEVDLDADLEEQLGATSVTYLEIVVLTERRLGIRFDPTGFHDARTIRHLSRLAISPTD